MEKILGRFYFKRSSNGNLLGEFSNNFSETIDIEGAVAKERTIDFIGIYETYWSETDLSYPITLEIKRKIENNSFIYSLRWIENGKTIIWGEGMLCDDILIGDYRNYKKI